MTQEVEKKICGDKHVHAGYTAKHLKDQLEKNLKLEGREFVCEQEPTHRGNHFQVVEDAQGSKVKIAWPRVVIV